MVLTNEDFQQFAALFDIKLNPIYQQLNGIKARLDTVENRLDAMDRRFDEAENRLDIMQEDISLLIQKTEMIEADLAGTKDLVSKIGNTLDNEVLPKIGSLYDGYMHNKDIVFRLVTNVEAESLEEIDTLKKVAEDHSERLIKLEGR